MLVLHLHPFASYCQKALIALYELDVPFERHLVEGEEGRAEHVRLWPMGGMPVLVDRDAGEVLPESSIVMEYVDAFAAERPRLIPGDPRTALEVRRWDRFFDAHVQTRCRRSWPTACAPRTHATRPASRRRGARSTPPTASCRSISPGATAGSRPTASRSPTARPRPRSSTAAPSTVGPGRARGDHRVLPASRRAPVGQARRRRGAPLPRPLPAPVAGGHGRARPRRPGAT